MKNYYFNPKTHDLLIFDTEGNEIVVLERMTGIRVFTSSELRDPAQVSRDLDFNQEPPVKGYKEQLKATKRKCVKCGKPGHRSDSCDKFVSEAYVPKKKATKRIARKLVCKNCGAWSAAASQCTSQRRSNPHERGPGQSRRKGSLRTSKIHGRTSLWTDQRSSRHP